MKIAIALSKFAISISSIGFLLYAEKISHVVIAVLNCLACQ